MGFAGISSCLCFLSFPIAVDCLNESDIGQTSRGKRCAHRTRNMPHFVPFRIR